MSYRLTHSFDQRQTESTTIRQKYPDRIPVIVEKIEGSPLANIDKQKYLVPGDLTLGQFMLILRKRLKLSAHQAIFVFIRHQLPAHTSLMSLLYKEYADPDGFLYISYAGENTFG